MCVTDIGGLDPIISSLRESVIYPLVFPELFTSSSLLSAPKGVLLYGPPGCGKTMLARALAKESGATFINIAVSTLANKWYGESNKLINGMFGLARKLQPSIIFIDEIDSFLRERKSGDHEVTATMKAEFMTCVNAFFLFYICVYHGLRFLLFHADFLLSVSGMAFYPHQIEF